MSENYVGVTAILRTKRPKAVKLSPTEDEDTEVWIARSCIHAADDAMLDETPDGEEITLRMFEWVARKENFCG